MRRAPKVGLRIFALGTLTVVWQGWASYDGRLARETEIDVPGLAVKPRRFEVKLDYRGKPFATVPVELSPVEGNSGDEDDRITVTEYRAIGLEPRGPVYCLSLRYQIATRSTPAPTRSTASVTTIAHVISSISSCLR